LTISKLPISSTLKYNYEAYNNNKKQSNNIRDYNERGEHYPSWAKANLEAFNLWHNNKSYKVQEKRYCPKMDYIPLLGGFSPTR
jgi:hypothetical protein